MSKGRFFVGKAKGNKRQRTIQRDERRIRRREEKEYFLAAAEDGEEVSLHDLLAEEKLEESRLRAEEQLEEFHQRIEEVVDAVAIMTCLNRCELNGLENAPSIEDFRSFTHLTSLVNGKRYEDAKCCLLEVYHFLSEDHYEWRPVFEATDVQESVAKIIGNLFPFMLKKHIDCLANAAAHIKRVRDYVDLLRLDEECERCATA